MSSLRVEGWPGLLAEYQSYCAERPFMWGQHDCVLMALGAISQLIGADVAASVRGRYTDALGAARFLRAEYGTADLQVAAETFAIRWQFPSIAPSLARRGDPVLCLSESGPALGFCIGRRFMAPGAIGAVYLPMNSAQVAWSI